MHFDQVTVNGVNSNTFCDPRIKVPYVISDSDLIQIFDVIKDWFH